MPKAAAVRKAQVKTAMAHTFVEHWNKWAMSAEFDFSEYLQARDLIGDGPGQILFLAHYDVKPQATGLASYSLMDFTDGSIVVRRRHTDDHRWQVAV